MFQNILHASLAGCVGNTAGRHAPSSHEILHLGAKCLLDINTLTVLWYLMAKMLYGIKILMDKKGHKPLQRDETWLITQLASLAIIVENLQVDTPPLPRDMQIGAKCIFSYSLPYIDCSGAMARIWP